MKMKREVHKAMAESAPTSPTKAKPQATPRKRKQAANVDDDSGIGSTDTTPVKKRHVKKEGPPVTRPIFKADPDDANGVVDVDVNDR